MRDYKQNSSGFGYTYEKELQAGETVILHMPPVTSNKRSVNDIGWQSDGDITIFGTLSANPGSEDAMWNEINDWDEVNKTVSAIKIVCGATPCRVVVRIIMC